MLPLIYHTEWKESKRQIHQTKKKNYICNRHMTQLEGKYEVMLHIVR